MKVEKVVLLGLDSVVPHFARRFMREGRMPNLERLVERGYWSDTMPTMPPWTPPGWASVATGAWPSTHGIEGFGVYIPGEPLWQQHEGFDSRLWKVESLWEAAARQGSRSILLKYPGIWPHKDLPHSIQVGGLAGYGGRKSRLDITHSLVFGTDVEDGPQSVRVRVSGDAAVLRVTPAKEPRRVREYRARLSRDGQGPRIEIVTPAGEQIANLRAGQWSDPIVDTFHHGGEDVEGGFRLKAMSIAGDLQSFRVYMTQNHPVRGYTTPPVVADELLKAVGPMFEYSEAYYEFFAGLIDEDTYLEVSDFHSAWQAKAMRWLAENHEWELFVTQNHIIDNSQHTFYGGIDPGHPDHDPAKADHYWDVLGRTYGYVDRLIGAASEIAGERGLVVVTGDHGHEPRRYTFHINNWLARNEYLIADKDTETGDWRVDWSRTRAVALGPVHVMVNLKGRNADGIVERGEEYDRLREDITDGLLGVRHDLTGKRVVHNVFNREDMDMFGLYGDGVGDLIYTVRPGFDVGASMRTQSLENFGLSEGFPLFATSRIFKELTSQHCSVVGFTPNNRTWTVFAGPGVRRGTRRIPIRLPDITPTICELAGLPMPSHAEGQILVDIKRPTGLSEE